MKESIKLPIFYFLMYAAFAAWVSFFNLHLDSLGFTGLQIGTLNALFISTSSFVVPFWGMMADKFGNNRIFLLLSTFCAIIVFLIGQSNIYLYIMLFVLMISFFQQPMGAVMDGMALGLIRTANKYSYGQFRLWGSAGYALSSLVVGYFALRDTHLIFTIAALLFGLISLVNLITLPKKPVTGRQLVSFKSFGIFFKNRRLFVFLLLIFLYGIGTAPLHQFINLYYKDIGAESSLVGKAFFIQAGIEIPFFLFSVRLLRRIRAEKIILAAMFVSVVRLLLYGFTSNPELAIYIGLLHGFTISLFLVGVIEYVQAQTPDHLRTTGQALIWAFHFGAGLTFGNIWLGFLRDTVGMQTAMHVQAAIAGLFLICMFFFLKPGLNSRVDK
jgi:PPP family 3-phenylpropionic acid transporter